MIRYRTSILAAVLGFAALASSPARAELVLEVNNSQGTCTSCDDTTNTAVAWNGSNPSGWNISALSGLGINSFFGSGEWLDLNNLEVDNTMSMASLTIGLSENDLSVGQAVNILSNFSGTLTGSGLSVTRSLYLDTSNALFALTTPVSSTTMANQMITTLENLGAGHHTISITEIISITATTIGDSISTDDTFSQVPEPMSLSLFGSGLLALGALSRRRRKAAKSA